jgi:hypothetical protein
MKKRMKQLQRVVSVFVSFLVVCSLIMTTAQMVCANITDPTVSINPTAAGSIDVEYTIIFHVGPTGALTHGISSIGILFPVDTVVAAGFIPGTVNDVAIGTSAGNPASRIVQVITPVDVNNNGEVEVVLTSGITNPTTPDDYNLTVWTSAEGTNIRSDDYTVTGAADSMNITVQPTDTVAGIVLTPSPTVLVVDASENPVEGVKVTVSGIGPFVIEAGTVTQTTGFDGNAIFDDLVITTAGLGYQLLFSADAVDVDNVTSDLFNITAAPVSSLTIEVQPSTTAAGAVISPAIQVKAVDAFGNNVSGLQVNVTLLSGSGVLSGDVDVVTTVDTGIATFDTLSIDLIGVDKVLNFSSGSLFVVSDVFNIIASSIDNLLILVQPSSSVAGVVISPSVQVRGVDAFGNNVSGASIQTMLDAGAGVLGGTTTRVTNATGVALFDDLWIDVAGADKILNFTSGSIYVTSDVFTIQAASAAVLSVVVQPSASVAGVVISPSVEVCVVDSFSNAVSGASIDVILETGSGVLAGTLTQVANATGVAQFDDLWVDVAGMDKVLNFTCGPLFVVSDVFSVVAGSVDSLCMVVQPSSTVAGVVISPSVQVRAVDAFGNNISGLQVNASLQTGTGVLSGDVEILTDGEIGIATFDTLSINLIGIDKVLRFSAGAVYVDSLNFTIISLSAACYAVMDTDHNGNVNSYVDVYFNTDVDNSSIDITDFTLSVSGVTIMMVYNDANAEVVTLKLSDKLTGGGPTVTILQDRIDDLLGNPIPSAVLTINTYRITFNEGWNMFSIPADVSGVSIPTVLASIWSNVDRTTNLLWYNASVNTWKYYSVKTQTGTLSSVEPGKAYWIHMNTSDILIGNYSTVLHGTNPAPIVELTGHRWNMIGTWTTYNQTASCNGGLSSLSDVLNDTGEILYKYTPSGGFIPIYGNTTIKMQPGEGYWLFLRTSNTGYYTIAEP